MEAEHMRGRVQWVQRPRGCAIRALILNHEIHVSTVPVTAGIDLLTMKQAAQRLAICRRTLERLIARGEFPQPVKIGGAVRIPVGDVQSFLGRLLAERGAA